MDMVNINRVYTRAGDDGTTALGGGQRVAKDSLRIDSYGTVDELNSVVGVAVAAGMAEPLKGPFFVIQQVLFNAGSDLCILEEDKKRFAVPGIEARHVEQLEGWIDDSEAQLPALTERRQQHQASLPLWGESHHDPTPPRAPGATLRPLQYCRG